jgi:hypothetical protein
MLAIIDVNAPMLKKVICEKVKHCYGPLWTQIDLCTVDMVRTSFSQASPSYA